MTPELAGNTHIIWEEFCSKIAKDGLYELESSSVSETVEPSKFYLSNDAVATKIEPEVSLIP